jgi:hypothetical protein
MRFSCRRRFIRRSLFYDLVRYFRSKSALLFCGSLYDAVSMNSIWTQMVKRLKRGENLEGRGPV